MSNSEITVPFELRPLRIVFEHKFGRYAGLRQIVGTTDEFQDKPAPACSEPFNAIPDQRLTIAGLISAHRRYLLYREIDRGRRTFDPSQI